MKKTLIITLQGLLILASFAYIVFLNSCAPVWDCKAQALAIQEQRPNIVVCWGMINDPGQPGHGQFHAQPYDPVTKAWLTIDGGKIHEHSKPQYNIFPVLKIKGKKYSEMRR